MFGYSVRCASQTLRLAGVIVWCGCEVYKFRFPLCSGLIREAFTKERSACSVDSSRFGVELACTCAAQCVGICFSICRVGVRGLLELSGELPSDPVEFAAWTGSSSWHMCANQLMSILFQLSNFFKKKISKAFKIFQNPSILEDFKLKSSRNRLKSLEVAWSRLKSPNGANTFNGGKEIIKSEECQI